MEEKNLTEKESLELITQMIQMTRKDLEVGQGNLFLVYGYFSAILGIAIFLLTLFTHSGLFSWGWCLMFALWAFVSWKSKKPAVITYTGQAIRHVWQIIGLLFILTFVSLWIFAFMYQVHFILMMPLSLIYVNIGVSITGIILKEKVMTFLPLLALLIPFYMLTFLQNGTADLSWNLLMSFVFLISMIIPGHLLNRKIRK